MLHDVIQCNPDALIKANRGMHLRNNSLDLAVVKYHGNGLVTDQAALKVISAGFPGKRQEVTGHIQGIQPDTKRICNGLINLIPGQRLITGNVERLANGPAVSHQADIAFCKIGIERHGPQRGTISLNQNRLARHHPANHLPRSHASMNTNRNAPLIIGVARTHNGDRESGFPVLFHQVFLAGNLVS